MKFTYYTIIGKDLDLLKGHVNNVKHYAGFDDLKCDKEFIVVVYSNKNIPQSITDSILSFCTENDLHAFIYDEPTTSFMDNLYACWNLGYELSFDGYVFRAGSDQVFSKNSFVHLYDQAEKLRGAKVILQANTIENSIRIKEINANSRHFCEDFGNTFQTFDYSSFEKFNESINKDMPDLVDIDTALRCWGHPTIFNTSLGMINRVDGCSWLMTKNDFVQFGPLPVIQNGVTGDVIIHDRLQHAGYTEFIVRDCITYHFVRGESMNAY
jgi:hypothetical protein